MRIRRLLFPILLLALAPRLAHSQLPTPSSERQAAMFEAARLLNEPIPFVLQHRQELALTGAQVTALETLATALRDSSVARTALRLRQAQQNATQGGLMGVMEWSGPIDEAAIRDAMREQAFMQAEIMISSARDRRAVGAILSPEQRARLSQLQADEMMKAARPPGR